MISCQSQLPWTTPVPEMAKTWLSGASSGLGNNSRAKSPKKELISSKKARIKLPKNFGLFLWFDLPNGQLTASMLEGWAS